MTWLWQWISDDLGHKNIRKGRKKISITRQQKARTGEGSGFHVASMGWPTMSLMAKMCDSGGGLGGLLGGNGGGQHGLIHVVCFRPKREALCIDCKSFSSAC
jgi:hypothetical protein